ncbi:MAG: hypothetical protein K0S53_2713 [Bacteroidetes bacterium]|jgi:hypothetical protein|nr:hypothetical protein [Bacteroidota bacterium]
MKTRKLTLGLALAAIVTAGIFSSCKKKEKEEKDSDTAGAADQSLASSTVNDMTSISDEAAKTYSVSSFRTSDASGLLAASCASITIDTLAAAKTITVNFGATNCVCNDGRARRGSLIISFTGRYRDSLTVITVTPQNYYVNDNQVTGSKTITNKGHNAAHHLVYEINANIQITKANSGGTISLQTNRQREWLTGENTLQWNDDIYSITGTANGSTSNGNSFSSNITSPLIRNMSFGCRRHFTQGTLEHTPGGKATRYIDFGNGTCDDQATVTINGNTYTITLP